MFTVVRPTLTFGAAFTGTAALAVALVGAPIGPVTGYPVPPQLHSVMLTSAADVAGAVASDVPFIAFDHGQLSIAPIGSVVDLLGLGGVHLTTLANFIGLGDEPLSTVLPGLISGLGLSDTTVNELVGDVGLTNVHLVPLLTQVVDALGMDNVTLGSLADGVGLGGVQVTTLLPELVDGLGIGDKTLDQLATGLGLGSLTLGALEPGLAHLTAALGLNSITYGDLVNGLGLSDVQISTILDDLGATGLLPELLHVLSGSNITTVGTLLGAVGLANADVFPGIEKLLADPHAGLSDDTVVQLLDAVGFGDKTVDQLLDAAEGKDGLLAALNLGTVDDLLNHTGIAKDTLGDLLNANLIPPDATIGGLIDATGLGDDTLGTLVKELLGVQDLSGLFGTSVDDALSNLGANADLDDLLDGLGIADHYLFTI